MGKRGIFTLCLVALPVVARAEEKGEEIRVTVADAVRSALASNPQVTRWKIDIEIAEAEVTRRSGLFDPLLRLNVFGRRDSIYSGNPEATPTGVYTVDSSGVQSSLEGRTGWGGVYALVFTTSRRRSGALPPFFAQLVPEYTNVLSARYTHPLRRDAGSIPNRGQVEQAKVAAEVTEAQQRELLNQVVVQVVASYWDLVVRHERVRIAQANLAAAIRLRELVEKQVKAGGAPRADITQTDVTVAERRQAVDTAWLAVVDAERALLDVTFLRQGKLSPADTLVLVDQLATDPEKRDFDADVAVAMQKRPELQRVERAIEAARLNRQIADNQRRARVDLYVEGGLGGYAGQPLSDPSINPPELLIGGVGRSYSNMFGFRAPFVEVGLQIELPVRNREREGLARQAELAHARERAVDVRSLVIHELRAASQRLVIATRRLQTAVTQVKHAKDNVTAQEARYRNGAGIVFDVFRTQEELARAQAEQVLAAAEQQVALAQVEAARGTLLERLGLAK
jgi:outer membrane protein TolC